MPITTGAYRVRCVSLQKVRMEMDCKLKTFRLMFSCFSLVSWKNPPKLSVVCSPFGKSLPLGTGTIHFSSVPEKVFSLHFSTFSPQNVGKSP